MKRKNQAKALALALLMVLSALLMVACGGEGGGQSSTDAEYTVSVTDAAGTPVTSGVVVKFMQNGSQAAMQTVNESGKAIKTLTKGDYTVELQFTGSGTKYTYDTENLTLSAEKHEVTVELYNVLDDNTQDVYISGEFQTLHFVEPGCTAVELNKDSRTYFLFTPTQSGLFEFSVMGTESAIGYYGSPFAVLENPAKEIVDGKFTISVREANIGTSESGTYVIVVGIDPSETDGVLSIQRIGEPEWDVSDEPWTIYTTTATLSPYTLPAGTELVEFDLTASTDTYKLVYNEDDGFYHLDSANGPLVYVQLGGAESETAGYAAPFQVILTHENVSRYFYNEDGTFVKKESYSKCLREYIEYMDTESGVYPLTEDLKYIIQNRGIQSGWFDPDNKGYLFLDSNGGRVPGINNEISWLFMCRYAA